MCVSQGGKRNKEREREREGRKERKKERKKETLVVEEGWLAALQVRLTEIITQVCQVCLKRVEAWLCTGREKKKGSKFSVGRQERKKSSGFQPLKIASLFPDINRQGYMDTL